MLTKEEVRHLWPFYFYRFMRGVVFLTTITLFVFLTEKGLSYTQGALLVAVSQLAQILSELFTGSVADTFGRKVSVILSHCVEFLIVMCVAFVHSFSFLLVLFSVWGVAASLTSGADSAWAIDSLSRRKHLLDKYYVKSRGFFKAGSLVAGGLSALVLFFFNNQMLWIVRAGMTVVMVVVLLFARESFTRKNLSTWKLALSSLHHFRKTRVLYLLAGATFFTLLATYVAESVALQDYKLLAGIPLAWWGILFMIATGFGIFAPHLGMKLSQRFQLHRYLAFGYGVLGVLYGMAIVSLNIWYVAVLTILFVVIEDFYNPIEEKLYNMHVPSALRASVNSLKAMIQRFGVMIGMLIAGVLVNGLGGALTITLAAVFVVPAVFMVLLIKK